MREKVTVPAIQARKCGPKIKMVTAYDAPSDAESYHMDEESARTLRILMRNEE